MLNSTTQKENLKPITFINTRYNSSFYSDNIFQQNLLLKAMQTTVDANELKKIVGLRSVAEVYRTIDKLSLRKEYHKALDENGITFSYIVAGIKDICFNAQKDSDRLSAYKLLLQSLGMDRYDNRVELQTGKNWEDSLTEYMNKKNLDEIINGEYEVNIPEVPKDYEEELEKEKKIGASIYE